MKQITVIFMATMLAGLTVQAQGVTYLSNLDQSPSDSLAVGSNSWFAAEFGAGPNAGGYSLNSIQLALGNGSGTPSGFKVMLYDENSFVGSPGNSLATLTGSDDPSTAGIYTYTPTSNLTLSSYGRYYIVLTAGTATALGAYDWNYVSANSYNPSGGWFSTGYILTSSDGTLWPFSGITGYPQYSINATAIPEPAPTWLLFLGSGVLFYVRQRRQTVKS